MARVEKPENGIIKSKKDILLHGEWYLLKCRNGYELYSEDGYIDRRTVRIRNKNGTLEPKSLKCEESNVKILIVLFVDNFHVIEY